MKKLSQSRVRKRVKQKRLIHIKLFRVLDGNNKYEAQKNKDNK